MNQVLPTKQHLSTQPITNAPSSADSGVSNTVNIKSRLKRISTENSRSKNWAKKHAAGEKPVISSLFTFNPDIPVIEVPNSVLPKLPSKEGTGSVFSADIKNVGLEGVGLDDRMMTNLTDHMGICKFPRL